MIHSVRKRWQGNALLTDKPRCAKVEGPAPDLSLSREPQLFRLVAEGNMLWKNVAIAMYVPAEDDTPEFEPC